MHARRHGAVTGDRIAVIELRGVSKRYTPLFGKRVLAVDDFSLSIREGEVLGIAGPNGAGKSTLIAILLGYLTPTAGSATVDGLTPRGFAERFGVGYLSELVAIPPNWRADDAIRRYATLAGVPASMLAACVDDVIARVGLEEHRGKRIKALSKGNLQKVALAQALVRDDVRLMILDEPTHGLDPVWTQRFRDLITGLRAPNRAIVMASHNLDELERVCDRVAIIDHGRLQRVVDVKLAPSVEGPVAYLVRIAEGEDIFRSLNPDAVSSADGAIEIRDESLAIMNARLARAIEAGVLFSAVTPMLSSLERQFRDAVGEGI